MGSDIRQYTPLKTIVSYYLDEENRSMADFDKCWILSFRALTEIGFNIAFEPTTVRLPVNGNLTANLPPDYIKWTKIGVINSSGEVAFLKVNNSLSTFRDIFPNRVALNHPDVPDQDVSAYLTSPFFYNYYFGNVYAPYFGVGAGMVTYGDCVVDETNKVIVFAPNFTLPEVLVEYIGSPQQNNDYQIQTVCQEAVIAFISWKMKTGSEQDYYARLTEARRKLKPITLQEIQQAIRENQKFSLKS